MNLFINKSAYLDICVFYCNVLTGIVSTNNCAHTWLFNLVSVVLLDPGSWLCSSLAWLTPAL